MLGVTIEIPVSGAVWLLVGQVLVTLVLAALVFWQIRWTRRAVRSQSRGIQWILGRLPEQIRMPRGLGIESERGHRNLDKGLDEYEEEIAEIERISKMTAEEWAEELDSVENADAHPVTRMTDEQIVALQKLRKNGGLSAHELRLAINEIEAGRAGSQETP